MTRNPPWTDQENAAVSALYFDMLGNAVNGYPYNKAQMIREAQCLDGCHQPLAARSRGSIEAKLMNCSAVHAAIAKCGPFDTMNNFGYRALSNYQASLKPAMREAHKQYRAANRGNTVRGACAS